MGQEFPPVSATDTDGHSEGMCASMPAALGVDASQGNAPFWGDVAASIMAGAVAAAIVSPAVTIMDSATSLQAVQQRPLIGCLRECARSSISRPASFVLGRPIRTMWLLYFGTYGVANVSETVGNRLSLSPVPMAVTTAATTVAVNVALGIRKDILFARLATDTVTLTGNVSELKSVAKKATGWCGARKLAAPSRLPKAVAGVFLLRDTITIFFSFVLADWATPYMGSGTHASLAAQLTMPATSQLLATPIHLVGLDLYSRPGPLNLAARLARQSRNILPTTIVRSIRIVPALGIGVYINKWLRWHLSPDKQTENK